MNEQPADKQGKARKERRPPQLVCGRIVRYRLPNGKKNAGEERPAIIVKVLGEDGVINLQVFTDTADELAALCRANGVRQGTGPGQWSWPPGYQVAVKETK